MASTKPVIPQNDNVAHALAGAGGGILSMVLTYVYDHNQRPNCSLGQIESAKKSDVASRSIIDTP